MANRAANPKPGGPTRVRYGTGAPTTLAPTVAEQNLFTQQALGMETAFGQAKNAAMENAAALKAQYAIQAGEASRRAIAEMANVENAGIARGVLGSSALVEQMVGVKAAKQAEVNAAANALRAGLAANRTQMQQAQTEHDINKALLEFDQAAAAAAATTTAYGTTPYYDDVTGGGGGGGNTGRGGGSGAGNNNGNFANLPPFVTGDAKNPVAPGALDSPGSAAILQRLIDRFPAIRNYLEQELNTRRFSNWQNDPTMEQARRLYKYLYAQNKYGA